MAFMHIGQYVKVETYPGSRSYSRAKLTSKIPGKNTWYACTDMGNTIEVPGEVDGKTVTR